MPNKRRLMWIAWGLWGFAVILVSTLVYIHPFNTNLCSTFSPSSRNWWAGRDLYFTASIDGFLYFPQFAIIFSPFAFAGNPVGDMAWRLAGLALYCVGLLRLAKLLSPQNAALVFALGTFAVFAPALSSIRCGQANLHIAGFLLNTTVELARKRWSAATIYLIVALAVKPIIFVMLLLAAAVYWRMIWRLAVGLAVFVLFPFATSNPHYVMAQYHACAAKLLVAALPDRAFCDLRGLLWTIGWIIPQSLLAMMQIMAAIGTLGLCLLAKRRWNEPQRSVFVAALSACYLMLFNPRTEENSYVILAGILAIPAAVVYLDHRRLSGGATLVGIGIWFSCDGWAYHLTDPWLKPLACVVLTILLICELLRRERYGPSPAGAEQAAAIAFSSRSQTPLPSAPA
ncbi:MAG: glycosyltransferase family 87 protein [Tepidisphaeraceae bacterium]